MNHKAAAKVRYTTQCDTIYRVHGMIEPCDRTKNRLKVTCLQCFFEQTNLVLDEATNELVFTVEEDLDIGDQVFRDYSPGIPNLELIRIWGFIGTSHPLDSLDRY